MGNFNRGGNRGGGSRGGRDFRGGSRFGGQSSGRPQMHDAVCAECGNDCQVPFRPTGKPVFCSNCFERQGGSNSRSFGEKRFDSRGGRDFGGRDSRGGSTSMHQTTCDKCGNDCEVPFRPTAGKPVYCNDCFGKGGDRDRGANKSGGDFKKQIDTINYKLDKIMKALGVAPVAEKSKKEKLAPAKKEKKDSDNEIFFGEAEVETKKVESKKKKAEKATEKTKPAVKKAKATPKKTKAKAKVAPKKAKAKKKK